MLDSAHWIWWMMLTGLIISQHAPRPQHGIMIYITTWRNKHVPNGTSEKDRLQDVHSVEYIYIYIYTLTFHTRHCTAHADWHLTGIKTTPICCVRCKSDPHPRTREPIQKGTGCWPCYNRIRWLTPNPETYLPVLRPTRVVKGKLDGAWVQEGSRLRTWSS